MRTLAKQASWAQQDTASALALVAQLRTVDAQLPRQYIAELVVVRLFSLFEALVEDCACRIICGFSYCDGTRSILNRSRPTRGFDQARLAMQQYNRTKMRHELRWNTAGEIAANLEKLYARNEHFVATLLGHGSFISDLRKTRNHIAHGNEGTHQRFQEVVYRYYGAKIPSMTPGRMLLSSRFKPLLVEQFCIQTGVILKAAIKG